MITNFYTKDSDGTFKQASLRYCTECMQTHLEHRETCWTCGLRLCSDCGASMPDRMYTACETCRAKKDAARELERFDKAEKISHAWHGPVYYGDSYYSDLEDMIERLDCDGDQIPGYVWACDIHPVATLTPGMLRDDWVVQDPPDDFDPDDIVIPDSMIKAIEEFNEANKHLVSWSPNFKKAVLIEKGEVVG